MSTPVIAFTQRINFKTLLEVECLTYTGFSPLVKNSVEELMSSIELFSEVPVLVLDESESEEDFITITTMLRKSPRAIGKILALTDKPLVLKGALVFPCNRIVDLIDKLKSLLTPIRAPSLGYISVPIESLLHFKHIPFDFYVQGKDKGYRMTFPANCELDEGRILELGVEGVKEVAFERKYNRDFALMLLNNMINKVEAEYDSEAETLKAANDVFLTTKEIVSSVGLKPKVIDVCESSMERINRDVTRTKDRYSSYLTSFQSKAKSNLSFQFRFVELTSYIATQFVYDLKFPNEDEQIKKIIFAAFFCDISLKDPLHINYRSEEPLEEIWHTEKKDIMHHAHKAAILISEYDKTPEDVSTIIKQHHGSLTGIGFPKVFPDTLHPLSKCLFAAQEVAFAILRSPTIPAKKSIDELVLQYKKTPFEDLMNKLKASYDNVD